jgi:hypothetical protein
MIEINLIPDVKQQYLKARKMRNLAVTFSIFAGLAAGALVVISILFLLVQVGREKLADDGIKNEYAELSQVSDLSNLVTIQNQLSLISGQHGSKSMNSRLFSVLQSVNPSAPNDVRFTAVELDPSSNLLTLEGVASAGYPSVEALKKTIANVRFEYKESPDGETMTIPIADELEVGETSFGETSDGRRVLRFEMTLKYPNVLFTNEAHDARLITPTREIDVTDSRIQVPDSLFSNPASDTEEDQ